MTTRLKINDASVQIKDFSFPSCLIFNSQDPPETVKEPVEAAAKEKEEKKKEKETKEVKETKEKVEKKSKEEGEKTTEKEKKEAEPNFEILQNPARVLRQQLKVIQLVEGSHYVPVKDIQIGGIVMVKHIQSDTEEELVEPVAGKSILFFFFLFSVFMKNFYFIIECF